MALVEAQDFASGTVSVVALLFLAVLGSPRTYHMTIPSFSHLLSDVSEYSYCASNVQSGRSTKLIHGGVRYLEQAFKSLDYEMYELVKEALEEVSHAQQPQFACNLVPITSLIHISALSPHPCCSFYVPSSGDADSTVHLVGNSLYVDWD